MRILLLVTRFPAPHTKGDQQRAYTWIRQLSIEHELTVISSAHPERQEQLDDLRRHATVVIAAPGVVRRIASTSLALLSGRPGQVGWMMPERAWRAATRRFASADIVLAITVRAIGTLPLPVPLAVDHVDALSLNMVRRARGPEVLPVRLVARFESRRLRRWERHVGAHAAVQVVTASEDGDALPFGPRPLILPVVLDVVSPRAPTDRARDIDVIFTGNMRYPPNRAAAVEFARRILPLVQQRLPAVRAAIAGRAADRLGLAAVPGLEIASDVADLDVWLRRASVAVVPLREGTGTPYKVLEAAANGAAVVTTPWVAQRFGLSLAVGADPQSLADAAVRLLDDGDFAAAVRAEGDAAVARHSAVTLGRRLAAALAEAAQRHD